MNIRYIIRLFKLTPYLIAILVVLKLILLTEFAGLGRKVSSLDISIISIEGENEQLERRFASDSSLLTISQKAKEGQFKRPQKEQFLSLSADSFPVALQTLR